MVEETRFAFWIRRLRTRVDVSEGGRLRMGSKVLDRSDFEDFREGGRQRIGSKVELGATS